MRRTIFTGFSPNLTKRDVRLSLGYLLLPWLWRRWRHGPYLELARLMLRDLHGKQGNVTLYDSGRSALFFALKALGVGAGDEVLVQAFTCVVVINAIRFTGAKPVYVDIRNDFNLDSNDLLKKITARSRVIIIQHTFGQPADMPVLLTVAKENGLRVIEDCAHSFAAASAGRLTGTMGDIGMFSFGSDKVVSCVRGGALFTSDTALASQLHASEQALPAMPLHIIWQHLMHAPIFYVGKALYHLGVGRWLLALARAGHVTNSVLHNAEKKGRALRGFPCRMPNVLAYLLIGKLIGVTALNEHRRSNAASYRAGITSDKIKHPPAHPDNIYLRYTIRTEQPSRMLAAAKDQKILLGDWYAAVVAPADSDQATAGYAPGLCPNAEKFASESVNLPTDGNIEVEVRNRIIQFVNRFSS